MIGYKVRFRTRIRCGLLFLLLFWLTSSCLAESFKWDRDELFNTLAQQFTEVKNTPIQKIKGQFDSLVARGHDTLRQIATSKDNPPFSELTTLERLQFKMAALAAALPVLLPQLQQFVHQSRVTVMLAARTWPVNQEQTHQAIYRVMYGGRAAVTEALIQQASSPVPETHQFQLPKSVTPSVVVEGVRVHSGDILLSRGGAPTSALISRGNDYPGNFSHIALAYVDPDSNKPLVIEALIEKGVVISTLEQYLKDKKYRMLILRLRPDHPELKKDPMLPHKVSAAMLSNARKKKIAYDFEMDWNDDGKYFCSEVVYHSYRKQGVTLWQYRTRITANGVKQWLGDLGVRNFTTLAPSDIEYDPNLVSVAEWQNKKTVYEDRIDNAILDVLLEQANNGLRLNYSWYKQPVAMLVKLFTVFQEEPIIPKGMAPSAALRAQALTEKIHPLLRKATKSKVEQYRRSFNYEPPYWELTKLVQEAIEENQAQLSKSLTGMN